MKKILIPALCAVMIVLSLAGCGGRQPDSANATVMPSPTAGTVVKTFTAKITSQDGNNLKVDLQNGTMKSTAVGASSPSGAEASGTPEASPSAGVSGVTKDVALFVPTNVTVTLPDGKPGQYSDIKAGKTATFSMIGNTITAIAINAK